MHRAPARVMTTTATRTPRWHSRCKPLAVRGHNGYTSGPPTIIPRAAAEIGRAQSGGPTLLVTQPRRHIEDWNRDRGGSRARERERESERERERERGESGGGVWPWYSCMRVGDARGRAWCAGRYRNSYYSLFREKRSLLEGGTRRGAGAEMHIGAAFYLWRE